RTPLQHQLRVLFLSVPQRIRGFAPTKPRMRCGGSQSTNRTMGHPGLGSTIRTPEAGWRPMTLRAAIGVSSRRLAIVPSRSDTVNTAELPITARCSPFADSFADEQ
ncbi:MAG TPA: hypothetical protein VFJ87_10395, partial [Rhodanobacteraceae bacterium]|nr:hypothetical protein [Rhodanobacteraceae bacterium]